MKTHKVLARKCAAAAVVLCILFALAACVPPVEDNGFQPLGGDPPITGPSIIINVDGGPVSAVSRSLSSDQIGAVINYYELVVQKFTPNFAALATVATDGWVYKNAVTKRGGVMVVGVDAGYDYAVLLLEGYLPVNGADPILLRSAYTRVQGTAATGGFGETEQGTANLALQNIETDPTEYKVVLGATALSGGTDVTHVPARVATIMELDIPKFTLTLPTGTIAAWKNPGSVKVVVGGISPLIQAKNSAAALGATTPASSLGTSTVANFFATAGTPLPPPPRMELIALVQGHTDGEYVLNWPWDKTVGTGTNLDGGTPNKVGITWAVTPTSDLEQNDCNALLIWDARYRAFSVTPSAADGSEDLKRWVIRNGLDNQLDIADAAGVGTTGGAVYVKIGNGGAAVHPGPVIVANPTGP